MYVVSEVVRTGSFSKTYESDQIHVRGDGCDDTHSFPARMLERAFGVSVGLVE